MTPETPLSIPNPDNPYGIPTYQDALFHAQRLQNFLQRLKGIDSRIIPPDNFSASERRQVRASNGGWVETGQIVELPIFPKDGMKGLRYLLCAAIVSELSILSAWGGHDEAMQMIKENTVEPPFKSIRVY